MGCLVIIVSGLVTIFIRHRISIRDMELPPAPEQTEADLSIKNFHHVATEDGIRTWSLDAASARLYSDKNKAKLENITLVFFKENHQHLTITAKNGELDTTTRDMVLSENIVAIMPAWRLVTERLKYDHQSRILQIVTPVTITGKTQEISADTMSYGIDSEIITGTGNVTGVFSEAPDNILN